MEIAVVVAIAVAAIAVVLLPLLRRPAQASGPRMSEQALDQQVAKYRAALKGGTVCEGCLTANPVASKFCGECGRPL